MSEAFAVQLQGDFLIPSQVAVVHRIKTYKNNLKTISRKCWSCPRHPALFQCDQPSPTWMRLVFALWQVIRVGGSKPWLDTRQASFASSAVTLLYISMPYYQLLPIDQRSKRCAPDTCEMHLKQVSCWSAIDPTMQRRQLKTKNTAHLINTGLIMSSSTCVAAIFTSGHEQLKSSPQSPSMSQFSRSLRNTMQYLQLWATRSTVFTLRFMLVSLTSPL